MASSDCPEKKTNYAVPFDNTMRRNFQISDEDDD